MSDVDTVRPLDPSMTEAPKGQSGRFVGKLTFVAVIGGAALLTALAGDVIGEASANQWSALVAGGAGLWLFLALGGRSLTASGLFAMSLGSLVGFAGYVQATNPVLLSTGLDVAPVIQLTVVSLLVLGAFADWTWQIPEQSSTPSNGPIAGRLLITVGCLMGVYIALPDESLATSVLSQSALFSATVLSAVWAFILPVRGTTGGRPWGSWTARGLLPGSLVCVYMIRDFSGYGRLVLVALLMSVTVVLSWALDESWLKPTIVVCLLPALVILAGVRAAAVEQDSNRFETGLESVLSPVTDGALALELYEGGSLEREWGRTIIEMPLVLIPRGLWEGKPVGWGREMAMTLYPNGAEDYSIALTLPVEAAANFGRIGLIPFFIVLALILGRLDRLLWRSRSPSSGFWALVNIAAVAVLAGGMADLAWGGAWGFGARSLFRLLLLYGTALVVNTFLPPAVRAGSRNANSAHVTAAPRGDSSARVWR